MAMQRLGMVVSCSVFLVLGCDTHGAEPARAQPETAAHPPASRAVPATPIRHLVVIFQENHSFDAFFGTYPVAANPPGQPPFHARPNTPSVNGLTRTLRRFNPNPSNPFRIDRLQAYTCDQDHE